MIIGSGKMKYSEKNLTNTTLAMAQFN